jgi:hypothetical protein
MAKELLEKESLDKDELIALIGEPVVAEAFKRAEEA